MDACRILFHAIYVMVPLAGLVAVGGLPRVRARLASITLLALGGIWVFWLFIQPYSFLAFVVAYSGVLLGYLLGRGPSAYPRFVRDKSFSEEMLTFYSWMSDRLCLNHRLTKYAVTLAMSMTWVFAVAYEWLWTIGFDWAMLLVLGVIAFVYGICVGILLKLRASSETQPEFLVRLMLRRTQRVVFVESVFGKATSTLDKKGQHPPDGKSRVPKILASTVILLSGIETTKIVTAIALTVVVFFNLGSVEATYSSIDNLFTGLELVNSSLTQNIANLGWAISGFLLNVIAGTAIARGQHWGRKLYLCVTPFVAFADWLRSDSLSVFFYSNVCLYIIVFIVLRRSTTLASFVHSEGDRQKTLGALSLFVAGILSAYSVAWLASAVFYPFDRWLGGGILLMLPVAVIGSGFAFLGAYLWSWDQWRGTIGSFLALIGFVLFVNAAYVTLLSCLLEVDRTSLGSTQLMQRIASGRYLTGVILLVAGAVLVNRQEHRVHTTTGSA